MKLNVHVFKDYSDVKENMKKMLGDDDDDDDVTKHTSRDKMTSPKLDEDDEGIK